MSIPLRVLLIEDSADDAELIVHELRREGFAPSWERVDTAEGLRAALGRGGWDVALCDFIMPRFSALAALPMLRELAPDLPVLVVSGEVGEEVALTAMRAGAHDFVSKSRLSRLAPAVARDLREAELRRARRRAEVALRASEQEFRLLFERSLDAIVIVDDQGNFRNVNAAACELFGYGRDQLLRMNVADLPTPGGRSALEQFRAHRGGGAQSPAFEFLRSDGERRVAEYSACQFDSGLHLSILRDQTERRRAEESLRVSESQWRTLISEATDLIFTLDGRGYTTSVNRSTCEVTGYGPDELIGRSPLELVRPERMSDTARTLSAVLGGGSVDSAEVEILAKDGRCVTLEVRGRTIRAGEHVVGTFHIARDVTERVRLERRLAAMLSVNRALTGGLPPAECQQRLLEAIGEGTGWQIGELWLADRAGRLTWTRGWQRDGVDGAVFAAAGRAGGAAAGTGIIARAAAASVAVVSETPFADDAPERRAAGERLGLSAGFAFAIRGGAEATGVLAFFGGGPCADTEALIELGTVAGAVIGRFADSGWRLPG